MSRKFTPKIVTANDLMLGDVVYLAADDSWVRDLACAELIEDEAHAQLRLLHGASDHHMVGVYLADVLADAGGRPVPTHFREEFRATGPSNLFHGKQAEPANV
jgi:uncharacterized protein DUF2849